MTNSTGKNSPQPQKAHLNQNLVIAIIGAVATLAAAIIPWVLDRAAQAEPSPTAIQATFTVDAPTEITVTNTVEVTATASLTPTLEPPTATPTPTEETGIFNTYLTFDFAGKFVDTSFKSSQSIYLFFDLNDPKDRNIVEVIVSTVEVPGVLADTITYQILDELTPPNVKLLISSGKLSSGKYKVEIYLNNTLEETLEFEVTE